MVCPLRGISHVTVRRYSPRTLPLQLDAPFSVGLVPAADLRAGDLDVLVSRGHAHAELLHRGIGDVIFHLGAAADQRLGQGDGVQISARSQGSTASVVTLSRQAGSAPGAVAMNL